MAAVILLALPALQSSPRVVNTSLPDTSSLAAKGVTSRLG